MGDKLFTLHIVILNHPAALPDAAEQPLVTGRNGSKGAAERRHSPSQVCFGGYGVPSR